MSLIDKQFADQLKNLSENMAEWNAARSTYQPLVDAFVKLESEPSFGSNYLYVGLSGDKTTLTKAIRVLRTAGLKPENDKRPGEKDSTFASWYRNEGTAVYLSFTSRVCRQVQTGTKTIEVPVYETVCS